MYVVLHCLVSGQYTPRTKTSRGNGCPFPIKGRALSQLNVGEGRAKLWMSIHILVYAVWGCTVASSGWKFWSGLILQLVYILFFVYLYFFGMSQRPIDKPRLRFYIFIIQKYSLSRTFEASFQVFYMWSWTWNEWIVKPENEILPILKPCVTMVQRRVFLIWCNGTATFLSQTTSVL